eukprot:scaffold79466_cov30-Prasinocladus_malaysianus.AAC.1
MPTINHTSDRMSTVICNLGQTQLEATRAVDRATLIHPAGLHTFGPQDGSPSCLLISPCWCEKGCDNDDNHNGTCYSRHLHEMRCISQDRPLER